MDRSYGCAGVGCNWPVLQVEHRNSDPGSRSVRLSMCPLRRHLRLIRWSVLLIWVSVHMVMKAPVWALLARIDLTGSPPDTTATSWSTSSFATFPNGGWWGSVAPRIGVGTCGTHHLIRCGGDGRRSGQLHLVRGDFCGRLPGLGRAGPRRAKTLSWSGSCGYLALCSLYMRWHSLASHISIRANSSGLHNWRLLLSRHLTAGEIDRTRR